MRHTTRPNCPQRRSVVPRPPSRPGDGFRCRLLNFRVRLATDKDDHAREIKPHCGALLYAPQSAVRESARSCPSGGEALFFVPLSLPRPPVVLVPEPTVFVNAIRGSGQYHSYERD
jgi:hypothetical protein